MSNTNKQRQVIELVRQKGVIQAKDLTEARLPREYLSRLTKQGHLLRIGLGMYWLPQSDFGLYESLLEVITNVPNGVLTLLSALNFHNRTTANPFEVWLAVDGRAWKPAIDYPRVRYISTSGGSLTDGVEVHTIHGVPVKVYCAAKTVADCFKFRNEIGLDVALEALQEGLWTLGSKMGHYCRICCCDKPNEKFSGKGRRNHVCKSCAKLPKAERERIEHRDEIQGFWEQKNISKKNRVRLKVLAKSECSAVAQAAEVLYDDVKENKSMDDDELGAMWQEYCHMESWLSTYSR
jgi:hypothetical protein